jgi:hypothetical protein
MLQLQILKNMQYTQTNLATKEIELTTFGVIMANMKKQNRFISYKAVLDDLKSGKTLKGKDYSYQFTVLDLDDYYPNVTVDYGDDYVTVHYFTDVYMAMEFKEEEERIGNTCTLFVSELYKNAHLLQLNKKPINHEG